MSAATRQKALDKIHDFTPHIGYPETWRDYSAYVVMRDDLVGDIQRGNEFEWNREMKRIDDPVDKSEWGMTPPTINAYYQRSLNGIFFPAAILQPPFFDPNADDAVNYGGIGAVIGHEISHGFDDQGSKYNGLGVLDDWWTADDRKAFDARTTALSDQFDTYEALPGLHLIGRNTLGENIADLAGLTIALKAYRISLVEGRLLFSTGLPATSASSCRRTNLAHEATRQRLAHAGVVERACAGSISRARCHAQRRCLVRGIRRAAGRQILPATGEPRQALVIRVRRFGPGLFGTSAFALSRLRRFATAVGEDAATAKAARAHSASSSGSS